MNEEFLTGLGIDSGTCEKILLEYNAEKLDAMIEKEFDALGAIDREAGRKLLDREGLCAENLGERLSQLKSEHPLLFKSDTPKIVSSAETKGTVKRGDFEKMGYKDRLALYKKSPDVYKKLVQ